MIINWDPVQLKVFRILVLFFNTYTITIKNNLYSPWIMISWKELEYGRLDGEFRFHF